MKFVYVDESGPVHNNGFLVFVGLEVDAHSFKKVKRETMPLLQEIADTYTSKSKRGIELKELKSSRMVNGGGGWRNVDPEKRKEFLLKSCESAEQIGPIYTFVIDCKKHSSLTNKISNNWRSSSWQVGAIAIAAFIQRKNKGRPKNKGLTVLIFDNNPKELPKLSEFLVHPSDDVNEYCGCGGNDEPFSHIVDTAFAINSRHSDLVQIADACAYVIRRRAELSLSQNSKKENWPGEKDFIEEAFKKFQNKIHKPRHIWSTPSCDAAKWLCDVSIPNFNKWIK